MKRDMKKTRRMTIGVEVERIVMKMTMTMTMTM